MLRALNRLMLELEFELVIVGPPKEPLYKNMLREVSPMLWHRVVFRERLASSQIMEELAQAVLLICPTLMDTGPVSVKESVVAGVPVVASAVGGRLRYSR